MDLRRHIRFWLFAPLLALAAFVASAEPRTVTGPAGRLHVDDGGTGPGLPVLFVHELAGSHVHWLSPLSHLRQQRRAVAFDLRGHGRSDAGAGQAAYEVTALARDVAAVADALGLSRFVLVGQGLGGSVAAAYAAAHPQRVAALVLAGTPGRVPAAESEPVMAALRRDTGAAFDGPWRQRLAGARPETAQQLRRELQRAPRETLLALAGSMYSYDPLPALQAYLGPKLLIETDHAGGPSSLHTQVPLLPRAVISGTSHWPQLDRPQEFNRVLDEFLGTVR